MANNDFELKRMQEEAQPDAGNDTLGLMLAFDAGTADDDSYFIGAEGKAVKCTDAWTSWYRKSGSIWRMCKDQDGYRVRKPGGGIDSWGRGYGWSDVNSAYGLSGVSAYKSACGGSCA